MDAGTMIRVAFKTVLWIFLLFLAFVALALAVLFYGEYSRERKILSYQPPPEIFDSITPNQRAKAKSIMKEGEILVCALGGYGRAENLRGLNAQQRASLNKDVIPSEDLSWYLIFFSESRFTRIYLMDNSKIEAFFSHESPGCVSADGKVSLDVYTTDSGQEKKILRFDNKGY